MVCSPGDPCIAGNNGKPHKKSGDPAGYDYTGAEPYKAEKNILKHTSEKMDMVKKIAPSKDSSHLEISMHKCRKTIHKWKI